MSMDLRKMHHGTGTQVLLLLVVAGLIGCKQPKAYRLSFSDEDVSKAKIMAESCKVPASNQLLVETSVRRLNNSQYSQTVRSLLNFSGDIGESLPADTQADSFDTEDRTVKFTGTFGEVYFNLAFKLADAYVYQEKAICKDKNFDPKCTGNFLVSFAERAFRRPLFADERARWQRLPENFIATGMQRQGAFAEALATVLVAPQFLFHLRLPSAGNGIDLSQLQLAERLSYFLWNDMPDKTLMELAKNGQLNTSKAIGGEVVRLMNAEAAHGFMRNFSTQWLTLKNLAISPPAASLGRQITNDMVLETQDFIDEFWTKNVNIKNLIDAPFTYLSAPLAAHYGVEKPGGQRMRVEMAGKQRTGLLAQGSFLVQTSNPQETSPVKRGKWILERILCSPPTPPPGNELGTFEKIEANLPVRQRLEIHNASPACKNCHKLMDPLGLALENFDAFGKRRDKDRFGPIDASGMLPPDRKFETAEQMAQLIKVDPAFPSCVVTKIATYALGRSPTKEEACVIQKIVEKSSDENYGLKNVVFDLAVSLIVP